MTGLCRLHEQPQPRPLTEMKVLAGKGYQYGSYWDRSITEYLSDDGL